VVGLAIRAGLAVLTLTVSGAIAAQGRSAATAQAAGSGECRDVTIVNQVNGREERSTTRMCRNAAGGWDPAGTAAQPAPSDTLPPDFRGRISYQGTHRANCSRGGEERARYGGSLNVELTFNGNNVTGSFSGTGGINTGTMSGTRTGNRCRMIESRGGDLIEGECTRTRFSAIARSQGNRDALAARFEANATRFVDAAAEERQRIVATTPAPTSPRAELASASAGCPLDPLRAQAEIRRLPFIERRSSSAGLFGPRFSSAHYRPVDMAIYGFRVGSISLDEMAPLIGGIEINYQIAANRSAVQAAALRHEDRTCRSQGDCVMNSRNHPNLMIIVSGQENSTNITCKYSNVDDGEDEYVPISSRHQESSSRPQATNRSGNTALYRCITVDREQLRNNCESPLYITMYYSDADMGDSPVEAVIAGRGQIRRSGDEYTVWRVATQQDIAADRSRRPR